MRSSPRKWHCESADQRDSKVQLSTIRLGKLAWRTPQALSESHLVSRRFPLFPEGRASHRVTTLRVDRVNHTHEDGDESVGVAGHQSLGTGERAILARGEQALREFAVEFEEARRELRKCLAFPPMKPVRPSRQERTITPWPSACRTCRCVLERYVSLLVSSTRGNKNAATRLLPACAPAAEENPKSHLVAPLILERRIPTLQCLCDTCGRMCAKTKHKDEHEHSSA